MAYSNVFSIIYSSYLPLPLYCLSSSPPVQCPPFSKSPLHSTYTLLSPSLEFLSHTTIASLYNYHYYSYPLKSWLWRTQIMCQRSVATGSSFSYQVFFFSFSISSVDPHGLFSIFLLGKSLIFFSHMENLTWV